MDRAGHEWTKLANVWGLSVFSNRVPFRINENSCITEYMEQASPRTLAMTGKVPTLR